MSRIKKVFTDVSEIAHLFAYQSQDEARNSGGNFYFYGDTIYSYGNHFPIASHVVGKQGTKAVALTTGGYSNTTAKHIRVVHSALFQHIIYCAHPKSARDGHHTDNVNDFLRRFQTIASNLPKAKKPEIYLRQMQEVIDSLNEYCGFFGINLKAAQKKKLAISNKEEYQEQVRIETIRHNRAVAKRHKEEAKKKADAIIEWRVGMRNHIYFRLNGEYDMLRYVAATEHINTSQNVSIPVAAAMDFYKFVQHTLETSGGCEDCGLLLDKYEIREITPEYIRIGCHKISTKEYQEIAKQLGWTK